MTSILDARAKLAAALAPIDDADPEVLDDIADSVSPPALMIGWGQPWLQPATSCFMTARLTIFAIAKRFVPGEGVVDLEELVKYTLDRLARDIEQWPLDGSDSPRVMTIAKTPYLATRITVRHLVTT